MEDNKVIDINEYKAGKDLDGRYNIFLSNAEKSFIGVTQKSMIERFYCTLRYLESHVRMLKISDELNIPMDLGGGGVEQIKAYMIGILKDLDELDKV